jgi:hypothetical protein
MRRQTYSPRVGDNPGFWRTAALVVGGIMVAVLFAGYQHPLVSAGTPINVAVLDFAAMNPLPTVSGVDPRRYVADDLAAALSHVTNPQLTVVSRKDVRNAEASLAWKMPTDLANFDRLAALAQKVGANYLFVGRITSLNVPTGGGGGGAAVTASVQIEAFDAAGKSILGAWVTGNGLSGAIGAKDAAVRAALHQANAKALPALVAKLPQ